jgi:hypothetical protein
MQTTAISATINPYSTIVAPSTLVRKSLIHFVISKSPVKQKELKLVKTELKLVKTNEHFAPPSESPSQGFVRLDVISHHPIAA